MSKTRAATGPRKKGTRVATTPLAKAPGVLLREELTVQLLRVDQLTPNNYNPNELTAAEFDELVAEVRNLGRLPKPVVVRSVASGWQIVDGEHGWRAASTLGLTEVLCEVVEIDDFESMRQTFKRNQHGRHDPVKLGRMFELMMEARGLSQRELATEMNISEATVRNGVIYACAAELRNRYAASAGEREQGHEELIGCLTVRQVRAYVGLPAPISDVWLDAGADLKALAKASVVRVQEEGKESTFNFSGGDGDIDVWRELVEAGLAGRVTTSSFVESAHEALRLWFFRREFLEHIDDLDGYLAPIADLRLPSSCVDRLPCRLQEGHGKVMVSPQQWSMILRDCATRAGDSTEIDSLLRSSLRLALRAENIEPLDVTDPRVIEAMLVVGEAPSFIRESTLELSEQYALARLLADPGLEPDEAIEAARQACHMLEERNQIRHGAVPVGMPPDMCRAVIEMSPATVFGAAVSRLRQERVHVEREQLVNDPDRLHSALLERLWGDATGWEDKLVVGRQSREVMAERLSAVPWPELQLLGAVVFGVKEALARWLDAVQAEQDRTRA